ncbi:MAG TPA: oligopeptide transporter, OPT family [bacterium]
MAKIESAAPPAHKPYVSSQENVTEGTVRAVVLGVILSVVFTAANAYLGLYVGMTVSASIPAAVISMAILRKLMKTGSILENNLVQTIASAGVSLASGIIFTIPAFFIWHETRGDIAIPSIAKISFISIMGGALGILMMIPLRRLLIRDEHHTLPYPEGTACAEVLIAGERGGDMAKKVIFGVGAGAIYKIGTQIALWKESLTLELPAPSKGFLGLDAIPALLGVGYILGPRISAVMLAGGALGTAVLVPMIAFFGSGNANPIFPSLDQTVSAMSGEAIRSTYVRYIGAGAVTMGGILSLLKALPALLRSLASAASRIRASVKAEPVRTDHDLPGWVVLAGSLAIGLLSWTLAPDNPAVIFMVMVFGFVFVTVTSRIVGLVGSSSSPVSGMTIATLLGTTVLFVGMGYVGTAGMVAALVVGTIVCVAVCTAGDISQDLKTGFLLGATPWKQQLGMFVGIVAGTSVIGGIVYLLGNTFGFVTNAAHPNALQAPQANLMAMIIDGVMHGKLPWDLIFLGAFLALIVELFGVSSLAFAVGLYLPVGLAVGVMVGGLVRWARAGINAEESGEDPGVLFSSGLIAGEALIGIGFAILASLKISYDIAAGTFTGVSEVLVTLLVFAALIYTLWAASKPKPV